MANAIRPGGVYKVGDEYQDANGKKVAAPTKAEVAKVQDEPVSTGGDDSLPEDFPGREELTAGGLTTLAAVRAASDEDLDAIDGIGPATIEKIRKAQG